MIKNFFDLNIISNNLQVEQKNAQDIAIFNGYPVCFISLQGQSEWRITKEEKFIYVFQGIIAIDHIDISSNNDNTEMVHVGQGIILKANTKYRIRCPQLSHILIMGQEDKMAT